MESYSRLVFLVLNVGIYNLAYGNYNITLNYKTHKISTFLRYGFLAVITNKILSTVCNFSYPH